MNIEKELQLRSDSKCELCSAKSNLKIYQVPPVSTGSANESILICETCYDQLDNPKKIDVNHWRCLNDSMWSQVPAVQVVVWRMLNHLRAEGWPVDLLEMLYIEEPTLTWAKASEIDKKQDVNTLHVDSNGNKLETGDTVVLIKDLNVKGANFTAKRGTSVRGISLVSDNPEHIEGRIDGQQIVILTKFVKKAK